MRDIKFRGLADVEVSPNRFMQGFIYGGIYKHDEHCTYITKGNFDFGVFHKETLGQFTGLQDKNGVDIYEGDILSTKMIDNSIHKVVIRYSNKYSRFVYCPLSEKWDFDRCVVDNPYERKNYQIIANIHQNPELLETK